MAPKQSTAMFFLIVGIMLINAQAFAQEELDKALYRFYYAYAWEFDTLSYNDTREDLIVLQVGQNISKSYSYYTFQSDSLRDTPDGDRVMRQFAGRVARAWVETGKIPDGLIYKRMGTRVYKNFPEGQVTVTDHINTNYYTYRDELHPQSWQITDSTKTIMDYACQMAVSDFRGRRWTAWFAPDLPISDGPWKFSGLPGLIMEAHDTKKHFHFSLVGIEYVENEPIVFSPVVLSSESYGKYEETTRIGFLRGMFRYLHNMPDIMNAHLVMDVFDASSSNAKRDFMERDFW